MTIESGNEAPEGMVLFFGSGPGQIAHPFHFWSRSGGIRSASWDEIKSPVDFDLPRDGASICIVARHGRGAVVRLRDISANLHDDSLMGITFLDGAVYSPRVSPSGRYIAIVRTPGHPYPPKSEIVATTITIIERNGSNLTVVADVESLGQRGLAWLDDEWLACVNRQGQLVSTKIDGSLGSLLAESGTLPASNGRGTLAYVSGSSIFIRSPDAQLTEHKLGISILGLKWGVGQKSILAIVPAQILGQNVDAINIETGELSVLFGAGRISAIAAVREIPSWMKIKR